MTDDKPQTHEEELTPETKKFIKEFQKNGRENLKKGNIQILMIFKDTCGLCHMQFRNLINYYGITFDDKMNLTNKRNIADKIYPIEINRDRFARDIVDEAEAWATKLKRPELKILHTPSWIDFQTHEFYGEGVKAGKMLTDMLNLADLKRKRSTFSKVYSKLLDESCDSVACTIPENKVKNPGPKKPKIKK